MRPLLRKGVLGGPLAVLALASPIAPQVAAQGARLGHAASPAAASMRSVCPSTGPSNVQPNSWSAARHLMAPRGAQRINLCLYSGLNAHPALKLVGSDLVTSQATRRQLIAKFDALKKVHGAIAAFCPADRGREVLAQLSYRDRREVTILTQLGGCYGVTNGDINRLAANINGKNPDGPRLIALLRRLTRPTG